MSEYLTADLFEKAEETTTAPEPIPLPDDFEAFERDAALAYISGDTQTPPRFIIRNGEDAATLMAQIRRLRLDALDAAKVVDAKITTKRAGIDSLMKVLGALQEELKALLDERAEAVEPFEVVESFYRPSLDAYLLAKIAADPKGEKNLTTPYGKLLSKDPGPKWSFGDEKALAIWAKQNLPSVVKEEPVVNKTDLKKLVKVEEATGGVYIAPENESSEPVFVPGVKVTTPPREITLEVTL